MSIVIAVLGAAAVFLFLAGEYFPVWLSVLVLCGASVYVVQAWRRRRTGLLMLILWIVYALPFIHLLSYIGFDFESRPYAPVWGGLYPNPYQFDSQIVTAMGHLGAVGALGFMFGISLSARRIPIGGRASLSGDRALSRTLAMTSFYAWLAVGVLLSWFAAPPQTIDQAAYTTSTPISALLNFGSAWLVSGVLLIFAFADSILEPVHSLRKRKLTAVSSVSLLVVIWFGLLRGDRELVVLPLIFLAMAAAWSGAFGLRPLLRVNVWVVALIALATQIVGTVTGVLRSGLSTVGSDGVLALGVSLMKSANLGSSSIFNGTWSAVLLTPLSVAGDYVRYGIDYRLGQTYFDLLASFPPGFLADAIGYTRPIDGLTGPAWEMRYGIGGTHAVVVPLMNFGIVGVFIIVALWTCALSVAEKRAIGTANPISMAFLGTIALAAPHWLWYGEKVLISTLIIWAFVGFIYQAMVRVGPHCPRPIFDPFMSRTSLPRRLHSYTGAGAASATVRLVGSTGPPPVVLHEWFKLRCWISRERT